jgi:hypothetical protein
MTCARAWFDKLTTLSNVEGQRPPSIKKTTNSKLEIQNSKQFQMVRNHKVQNKPVSDFAIGF